MGHRLRYLPPESNLVEVTIRTVQGRFLLQPNHSHRLLSPEDSLQPPNE